MSLSSPEKDYIYTYIYRSFHLPNSCARMVHDFQSLPFRRVGLPQNPFIKRLRLKFLRGENLPTYIYLVLSVLVCMVEAQLRNICIASWMTLSVWLKYIHTFKAWDRSEWRNIIHVGDLNIVGTRLWYDDADADVIMIFILWRNSNWSYNFHT